MLLDYDNMHAMQVREETGELPDEVYYPTAEDADDPDSWEIAEMVREQYAATNEKRRTARDCARIQLLESLLLDAGITIPE